MPDRSVTREDRNGQRALDRTYPTVEREFTNAHQMNEVVGFREISVGPKDAQRDGQIKTRTFFAHVGRSEIDRRLLQWKQITAILNGGPNAFARLAHGSIR